MPIAFEKRGSAAARAPFVLGALLLAATLPRAQAQDGAGWPQWRGPRGDNVSTETGWMPEGREDSLWEAAVGLGYSSFAVHGGRLYTMGHDEARGTDSIFCLDAETGVEIWTHSFPARIWNRAHGGGTLVTPAVDGDRVYASNREGRLFCLRAEDGDVLWSLSQKEDFDLAFPRWGFSASPLVLGELLVMNLGAVVAYEKRTGEPVWKTAKNYGDAYSTPFAFELRGQACVAVFAGKGLVILDVEDGSELAFQAWETPRANVNAMTPIVSGDRVFISSGYNRGCALVELGADGAEVLWESKVMRNQMTGCVLWEGHLYGFDDAIFKCLDLEGNELWRQRGLGKGAHMLADGKLVILSEEGELIVAEATPEGFRELSRAQVLEEGPCWTTPVLVDGRIYCRNSSGALVARDHRPR